MLYSRSVAKINGVSARQILDSRGVPLLKQLYRYQMEPLELYLFLLVRQ
ncbi:enolase domain protein [Anaplasma phagocytophilum]|nr:enolase domain protein [Anaplasma phagocytophilum]